MVLQYALGGGYLNFPLLSVKERWQVEFLFPSLFVSFVTFISICFKKQIEKNGENEWGCDSSYNSLGV